MKQLPNLFTLLNLLFGCCAIVTTLELGLTIATDENGLQWVILPEKIWLASLFIGLAAVVDFLDGFVARWLKASSEMGKQLDSLADVVSFGVAPSVIVYFFLRLSLSRMEGGLDLAWGWKTPAFLLAAAAAWRLARFNLTPNSQPGFQGVPTPAVGLLIASFPLIYWNTSYEWVTRLLEREIFWYAMIVIVSALMISRLPLLAFKFSKEKKSVDLPLILLAVSAIAGFWWLHWLAIPLLFVLYILLSLAFKKK